MRAAAVITAGGNGTRMGVQTPKQFLPLGNKTVLERSVDVFEGCGLIAEMVLVLPEAFVKEYPRAWWQDRSYSKVVQVVCGGKTRQASVFEGLKSVSKEIPYVAIHDGARCLLRSEVLERALNACENWQGAIAAVPVRDSLKETQGEKIVNSVSRENLWAMQTPQVFEREFILEAYQKAAQSGFEATDDAQVAEHSGGQVCVVESESSNLKITHPSDLDLAEMILKQRGQW